MRIFHITYIISDDDIKGADWKGDKLEYTVNDDIILPTVSNPNLTFKGWKIRSNGEATDGKIYSGQIAAGTFTGDIELVPYYVVTVTFETDDPNLDINNVLGTPEGVNYLEFEIGETLENLPMGGGEDVFAEMYYIDEEGEPVDIIDTYQDFVVTKNITLWVRDGSSAGIV